LWISAATSFTKDAIETAYALGSVIVFAAGNEASPVTAGSEAALPETISVAASTNQDQPASFTNFGQFVDITIPGVGEAPFTPSSDPNVKDKIEVTIMNVGRVTSIIHNAKAGDVVGLRGPYGKGYPLDEFKNEELLIVGGGVGLAPLRSLLLSLFAEIDDYKKIIFRYGARTPSDIIYKNLIPEWSKRQSILRHRKNLRPISCSAFYYEVLPRFPVFCLFGLGLTSGWRRSLGCIIKK